MTKNEKYELIKNWLVENNLYRQINPTNEKDIEDYVFSLGSKINDLYELLRKKDLIPEKSYQQLINTIEERLIVEQHFAVMGL
jgi:succinate dehydrogenase flavin-adding protein (antitoxin of CptAB toxin-antitoxin module)